MNLYAVALLAIAVALAGVFVKFAIGAIRDRAEDRTKNIAGATTSFIGAAGVALAAMYVWHSTKNGKFTYGDYVWGVPSVKAKAPSAFNTATTVATTSNIVA